jgi:LmbE family N-acetylglucosaminyl deacetylase
MAEDEEEPKIERALVVHAHPDDMEFGCAGTVAKWTDAGIEVDLVICTEGNRGGEGDRSEEELVNVRRKEQAAAQKILGIKEVVYLGYDDGYLMPSLELRKDITRQIRRFRPQIVICPNPVRHFGSIGGNHPDHLAVGEATFAAVYPTARNPMAVPELLRDEGLEKWVVSWIYLLGRPYEEVDHVEDITGTIDRKTAALECHKSQLPPEVAPFVKWMSGQSGEKARERGLGDYQFVEMFMKLWVGEIRRPEDFKRFLESEGLSMPQAEELQTSPSGS